MENIVIIRLVSGVCALIVLITLIQRRRSNAE